MTALSNAAETALLELIFNGDTWANLADDTATSPATNLTVALHTADPGEAGDQTTNEATYTGYERVNVARTSGGWTVTDNSVSPAAEISFAAATGGSETITHFSIGTGTGDAMIVKGTVTPNIVVSSGVTPKLTAATAITAD